MGYISVIGHRHLRAEHMVVAIVVDVRLLRLSLGEALLSGHLIGVIEDRRPMWR